MSVNAYSTVYNQRIYDYVPLASTAKNLYYIYQKYVAIPTLPHTESKNFYYTNITQKSPIRCAILLFPFIGNLVIGLYDFIFREQRERSDWTNIFQAFENNEFNLDALPSSFRNNRTFLLEMCGYSPRDLIVSRNFPHIPEQLRQDESFVIEAIQKHRSIYSHLSDSMKNNDNVIDAAMKSNPAHCLYHAPARIKGNGGFILRVLQQMKNERPDDLYSRNEMVQYVSDRLKGNREFALRVIEFAPRFYFNQTYTRNNPDSKLDFCVEAMKVNPHVHEYLPQEIKESLTFQARVNVNRAVKVGATVLETVFKMAKGS